MEIEGKILEIDKEEVIRKLEEMGAEKHYEEIISVRIVDFKDGSLNKEGKTLRARKIGDKTEFTFKGPRKKDSKLKIREEIETYSDDFDSLLKILERIGITPTISYDKKRISYKLGDVSFEIDEFIDLPIPVFIEIEAPSEEKVIEMIEKLGFKKEDMKSYGLNGLLNHYNIDINKIKVR